MAQDVPLTEGLGIGAVELEDDAAIGVPLRGAEEVAVEELSQPLLGFGEVVLVDYNAGKAEIAFSTKCQIASIALIGEYPSLPGELKIECPILQP